MAAVVLSSVQGGVGKTVLVTGIDAALRLALLVPLAAPTHARSLARVRCSSKPQTQMLKPCVRICFCRLHGCKVQRFSVGPGGFRC